MKMIISGKNIDVTPGLRSAVESKLGKLERYFTADTEIYVTLSVEKDRQKIEVTIPMKGNIIRSEQTSSDMYVSIDLVEEIIERQLRRYKTKLIAQQQAAASFQPDYLEGEEEEEENRQNQEVRYQTDVSGGCLRTDGAFRTQLLCILQCRDGSGKCCLQKKRQYLRAD